MANRLKRLENLSPNVGVYEREDKAEQSCSIISRNEEARAKKVCGNRRIEAG
jgi:hypothetical protein